MSRPYPEDDRRRQLLQYTLREHRQQRFVRVELTAHVGPGESGTAKLRVWDGIALDYVTTTQVVTVYEADEHAIFGKGQWARAYWNSDAQRWELLGDGGVYKGILDEDLLSGSTPATVSVEMQNGRGGAWQDTGINVEVEDCAGLIASGKKLQAGDTVFFAPIGATAWCLLNANNCPIDQ